MTHAELTQSQPLFGLSTCRGILAITGFMIDRSSGDEVKVRFMGCRSCGQRFWVREDGSIYYSHDAMVEALAKHFEVAPRPAHLPEE